MANGTRVRDWASVDYYARLGIAPSADADEVTRAFRSHAKRLHPDATDDETAAERFKDVAAAYAVLSDADARREYDRVRAEVHGSSAVAAAVRPAATPRKVAKPWSRRRAWTSLVAGTLVALLGVGAAVLTWSLHEHDARRRARFVPVTATRIDVGGSPWVSFETRTGIRVTAREPQQHGDPSALGPTTHIRYDPADPEHVIVDASSAGRDITFAIVALKLLIGGPVFMVLGWRKLRARGAR
jgi:DnaJ domain/Protein of unknown function (DUF3592)